MWPVNAGEIYSGKGGDNMIDVYTLTQTAQAIADMKLNGMLTLILVTFISIVNLIAMFKKK